MKQASFIVNKGEKLKTNDKINIETTNVETTNVDSRKNINSKKPIKLVENIYYFR